MKLDDRKRMMRHCHCARCSEKRKREMIALLARLGFSPAIISSLA